MQTNELLQHELIICSFRMLVTFVILCGLCVSAPLVIQSQLGTEHRLTAELRTQVSVAAF
jgi:hypothetical protein